MASRERVEKLFKMEVTTESSLRPFLNNCHPILECRNRVRQGQECKLGTSSTIPFGKALILTEIIESTSVKIFSEFRKKGMIHFRERVSRNPERGINVKVRKIPIFISRLYIDRDL
jgi:hypothetical protein